ncbi:MFS transporter [Cryptosporangium sp. NPDC048952]|uniref:MFS transporter n=1 Tax=Cryptosporangium sp. NPDC048952 TaxID=3363961 RepID=UPI00371D40EF
MTTPVGTRVPARAWAVLAILSTAQFLVVLSTSIVNIALPAVRDGIGLSGTALSWVVNAYVLAFGALLLPGGRIADLAGRRRIFLTGVGVFTAAVVAAGLAPNAAVLISARAVQGLAAALIAPAALALTLGAFPPGRGRGVALGVWGAVSGAGGAAGVLLGGVLTQWWGWRSIFLASAPLAIVVLVGALLMVAADRPKPGRRLDVIGTITLTAGLLSLTYSLTTLRTGGGTVLPLIAGLLLLGAFVARQRTATDPLVPPRVLGIRTVAGANASMLVLGAIWIGLFYFLPLYQQQVLHYSPLAAGVSQLPLALMVMTGSAGAPWLAARLGHRTPLIGGLLLLAAGLFWLARTPQHAAALPDVIAPTLLIGAGLGTAFVGLTTLSTAGVPAAETGVASGLINATRQVGGALGLALLIAVSGPASGYGHAFVTAGVLSVIAAGLGALVQRPPAR